MNQKALESTLDDQQKERSEKEKEFEQQRIEEQTIEFKQMKQQEKDREDFEQQKKEQELKKKQDYLQYIQSTTQSLNQQQPSLQQQQQQQTSTNIPYTETSSQNPQQISSQFQPYIFSPYLASSHPRFISSTPPPSLTPAHLQLFRDKMDEEGVELKEAYNKDGDNMQKDQNSGNNQGNGNNNYNNNKNQMNRSSVKSETTEAILNKQPHIPGSDIPQPLKDPISSAVTIIFGGQENTAAPIFQSLKGSKQFASSLSAMFAQEDLEKEYD
ncbi:MAG: hypothetical protein EZS28_035868, partial [Streblomastix strix]